LVLIIEHVTVQRMDHVGIVVDDLAAATEFFVELGLELQGEMTVEGVWVDRIVGVEGVRADIAMLQTPDGNSRLEVVKFHSPSNGGDNRNAPANTPGIRHITFAVDDIDSVVARLRARGAELVGELEQYKDLFRLCYIRGPAGIIELAEELG
jgi:catechol 2,3-dioxygenase-like lactoylglutathione lyase family enzyme